MNSSSIVARIGRLSLAALLCASCAGCYLIESAQGQLSLMSRRVPIARVIADPATPAAVRRQLEAVDSIRAFAVSRLGLPDNGSYRSYADVRRPYVVWNVVAAPEFSVDAREWCYPIVGCVAYRGYFALRRAQSFAGRLRRQGYDVDVSGVAAYSTLGHFDDPVLNTMLGWSDVELASIIFHELTHQMLYLPNDADFNEAFATAVEEAGVRRWLIEQGREQDLERYELEQHRYLEVVDLLNRTRDGLRALYAEPLAPDDKRARKQAEFDALHTEYLHLTAGWGAGAPFASWFETPLNNANLASVATYFDCVPGFQRELAAEGGDLEAFYRRVRELAAQDQKSRDAALCRPGAPRAASSKAVPPRGPFALGSVTAGPQRSRLAAG